MDCPVFAPSHHIHLVQIHILASQDQRRHTNPSAVHSKVVFDSIEPNPSWRSGSGVEKGGVRQYWEPLGPNDDTLIFESRFESGNLRRAIQIYPCEYDLILRPDINTRGHTQWYYFSVGNVRKGRKYKFNLINLMKPDSAYNQGLRPLIYSETEYASTKLGWHRTGGDIAYYQNSIKRKGGSYYTLTFTVTFQHDDDTCYLAHCYPYTYTNLQQYLSHVEADPKRANRIRRRVLCQTLAGNNCDLLTITSFSSNPDAMKQRKGILITARVHPGERHTPHETLDPQRHWQIHHCEGTFRSRQARHHVKKLEINGV